MKKIDFGFTINPYGNPKRDMTPTPESLQLGVFSRKIEKIREKKEEKIIKGEVWDEVE